MAGALFHSFHLYLALFLCTNQNKSYLAALSSGGCNKSYLEMREYLLKEPWFFQVLPLVWILPHKIHPVLENPYWQALACRKILESGIRKRIIT